MTHETADEMHHSLVPAYVALAAWILGPIGFDLRHHGEKVKMSEAPHDIKNRHPVLGRIAIYGSLAALATHFAQDVPAKYDFFQWALKTYQSHL